MSNIVSVDFEKKDIVVRGLKRRDLGKITGLIATTGMKPSELLGLFWNKSDNKLVEVISDKDRDEFVNSLASKPDQLESFQGMEPAIQDKLILAAINQRDQQNKILDVIMGLIDDIEGLADGIDNLLVELTDLSKEEVLDLDISDYIEVIVAVIKKAYPGTSKN